jgi:GntR family transcriptional regulator, transcriptional repressor for pyruvate dehydrogenase complex
VKGSARSAVFAPLDQMGRAETVARRLIDAITLGLLADGEQLPSETELASKFGVSTVTVREALIALRQQGLVQTRRGRGGGSFVRAPASGAEQTLAERLAAVTLAEIRDIGDHYLAIAGTAAKLAAERATPDDVIRIRATLNGPTGAAYRTEREFHLEVVAAAQSRRLTQQEVRLQGEAGALLWRPAVGTGPSLRAAAAHEAIVAAISAADPDRARALTEQHVQEATEQLAEVYLQLVGRRMAVSTGQG